MVVMLAAVLAAAACTQRDEVPSVDRALSPQPLELTDVARDVGLDFRHGAFRWGVSRDPAAMMGAGLCWLDYDADGWLDLFAVNSYSIDEAARWKREEGGLPQSALFRNDAGRFTDVTVGSGAGLSVRGNGCVAADFDLDGNTDLFVTTSGIDALLWNEGDGTFSEGAGPAGVDASGWHTGAAVGDVNGDGWPELFVAGYADLNNRVAETTLGFPTTFVGVRDLLFLNEGRSDDGRVTFREVGADAGLEVVNFEHGLGAIFSDLDRDGDLDLYVANDSTPNRLYDNVPWPGGAQADPAGLGFRFEELAGRAGAADPNAGMGVAAGDWSGDGRADLFVTNARGQLHAAYRSQIADAVDPSFADVRLELGPQLSGSTGWGVTTADLDLDSDLDLFVVNGAIPVRDLAADAERVQAFGNLAAQGTPGRFEDLSDEIGLRGLVPLLARGSAAADYDNDGDLDIAINSIGGALVLLENSGTGGNWLEVQLGRFAPGARIVAALPDGSRQVREVLVGSSYLSSEDLRAHFGLGTVGTVTELVVRWPNGEETVIDDVTANQVIVVEAPG